MPMDRNITRFNSFDRNKDVANDMKNIVLKPKKSTLDFVCRFARAYQFEPKLGQSLGSFIVN
jgi:hypothetical protein